MAERIFPATTDAHYQAAHTLFVEYAGQLGHDLCFQHFSDELQNLPAMYGPPRGRLLLAEDVGAWLGCVATRPRGEDVCEMKRLFVRPAYRRTGLGRRLALEIIGAARELGFRAMQLDTLRNMTVARTLYESLGFREVPAYYHNPIPGAVYYELRLTPP